MTVIMILAGVGFVLSVYGVYVERKIKQDPSYKPACDLSDMVSCSKPILSPYGNMFIVSNALIGSAFYAGVLVLALLGYKTLLLYAACAAVMGSVPLAYILYAKIKSVCLLCTAIYVVNIFMLVTVWREW